MKLDLKAAAVHAREVATQREAEGCMECAEEHRQLAEWLDELQAYKGTGVSAQELQDVVDLFTEVTMNNVDIPKEVKRWMERCTWHVRKCTELSGKLSRAKEEAECLQNNYTIQVNNLCRAENKLRQAEKLISAMKADLMLAASGYCCRICGKKDGCADAAQVTCCSAFQYYKTEG